MKKIAVCDDEMYFLELATDIIDDYFSGEDLSVFTYNNKADFDKVFNADSDFFDIIIIDIKMPDISGIDFAKCIREKNTLVRIIFLTNYIEYATDVYEADHTYFVIKNDAIKMLPIAINKAISQLDSMENDFIVVNTIHSGRVVIKIKDIIYAERQLRDTVLYTVSGREITSDNLDSVDNQLSNKHFCRIHRSYLINLNHIKRLNGNYVIMSNSDTIHITRNYVKKFKEVYVEFMTPSEIEFC